MYLLFPGDLQQSQPDLFAVRRGTLAGPDARQAAKQQVGDIQVELAASTSANGHNACAPIGGLQGRQQGLSAHQVEYHIEATGRRLLKCVNIIAAAQGNDLVGDSARLQAAKCLL
ncbi:hypothetical protein D3C85_1605210 [compost metagenome]